MTRPHAVYKTYHDPCWMAADFASLLPSAACPYPPPQKKNRGKFWNYERDSVDKHSDGRRHRVTQLAARSPTVTIWPARRAPSGYPRTLVFFSGWDKSRTLCGLPEVDNNFFCYCSVLLFYFLFIYQLTSGILHFSLSSYPKLHYSTFVPSCVFILSLISFCFPSFYFKFYMYLMSCYLLCYFYYYFCSFPPLHIFVSLFSRYLFNSLFTLLCFRYLHISCNVLDLEFRILWQSCVRQERTWVVPVIALVLS
jgi:hypothetical protein